MSGATPDPGWYDDPSDPSLLRFWDGRAWTAQTMQRADLAAPEGDTEEPVDGLRNRLKAKAEKSREQRRRQRQLANAHATNQQATNQKTVEEALAAVQDAAQRGAILEEEQARLQMLATARSLGGLRWHKYAESLLDHAQSTGSVRIGAELIGVVKSEGFFSQYARKEALDKVSTGKPITVLSDRVFQGEQVYVIDEYTNAQVYLDGVEQITQRPTLTRMALLSPLPGTALIPGLALQKKKKNDMRHAEFLVGGRDWSITTPINPDNLQEPRRIAQMINSNADAIARNLDRALASEMTQQAPQTDVISQLERLSALRAQGVLSDAEFDQMKSVLLNQESSS